jgi:mycobactin phenyloxazoline synthetase
MLTRERPPCSSLEQVVAQLIGQVLGRRRVSAEDDFFVLGGDPATANAVSSRLGRALGTASPPIEVIVEERTVLRIARRLAAQEERLEAYAGIWLAGEGMSDSERAAYLRSGGCS